MLGDYLLPGEPTAEDAGGFQDVGAKFGTPAFGQLAQPLYTGTENSGLFRIRLIPIMKPGIDPHDFEPSPLDVKQIESADLVLITGKGMGKEKRGQSWFIDMEVKER